MSSEQQLKTKSYYQMYMKEEYGKQPLQALGEKYMKERQKEVFDLSSIRFAQGEVYFLNKDYEAAIFKWENISFDNELYPWARKNIADAHFQMEFLAIAEDYYKEIETNSTTLQMEILLNLFVLYIRREKIQEAEEAIQKAVELNPDYSNVTKKARAFYEKEKKFQKAMELAVKEAMRTKSISWFQVIKTYVDKGFIFERDPKYFLPSLEVLYSVDKLLFEQLVISFWNYYRDTDMYFTWITMWNEMFLNLEEKEEHKWEQLATLFKTTFTQLTNGDYIIEEIAEILPKLLTNGYQITKGEDKRFFSAILIVWDEKYPFRVDRTMLDHAKDFLFEYVRPGSQLESTVTLFETMINWAKKKEVEIDNQLMETVRRQLDFEHYYVLVSGDYDKFNKRGIDSESTSLLPLKNQHRMIFYKIPKAVKKRRNIQTMHPPELIDMKLVDYMIFVIRQEDELEKAIQLKDEIIDRVIHFVINKDFIHDEISSKIKLHFPNAVITFYSEKSSNLKSTLDQLFQSLGNRVEVRKDRTKKLLDSMKHFIPFLLDKRRELENHLLENIERNEEIAEKLYQAILQLHDLQEEKVNAMKNNYRLIIKELRTEIQSKIPTLLKDCSNLVTIESDFENIHVILNEEMNRRMVKFIEKNIYQLFRRAFSEWMIESERILKDTSTSLDEISASFNYMFGEEKMNFVYDFKVLDDWKRDADRMSRGTAQLDKVNILMRSASSQFFVKGAGKIFGTIPSKNKNVFYKKYQQFIENKDYEETAKSVADRVMQQYEFFEASIERDMELFFLHAFEMLQELLQTAENRMEEDKQALYEMTNQPEIYEDPIKLFELKVVQLEKLILTGNYLHNL